MLFCVIVTVPPFIKTNVANPRGTKRTLDNIGGININVRKITEGNCCQYTSHI